MSVYTLDSERCAKYSRCLKVETVLMLLKGEHALQIFYDLIYPRDLVLICIQPAILE